MADFPLPKKSPLRRARSALRNFLHQEAAGGIVLIAEALGD